MKKIKHLNYYNGSGYTDDRDIGYFNIKITVHPLSNEIDLAKKELAIDRKIIDDIPSIYCTFKTRIGNIDLAKTFTNIEYPLLNNFIELLNKVDFEKVECNIDSAMIDDIALNEIEYAYDNCDELKVLKNPANTEILALFNDFLYNYLLKDNELQTIFKAIVAHYGSCNPCIGLKYIIENNKVFDINKKYELN